MKKIKAENWKLAVGDEVDVIIKSASQDDTYNAYSAVITDIDLDDSDDFFKHADIYVRFTNSKVSQKLRATWTQVRSLYNSFTDIVYYDSIENVTNVSLVYIILPKGQAADYILQQIRAARRRRRETIWNCWKYKLSPNKCKFKDKSQII